MVRFLCGSGVVNLIRISLGNAVCRLYGVVCPQSAAEIKQKSRKAVIPLCDVAACVCH